MIDSSCYSPITGIIDYSIDSVGQTFTIFNCPPESFAYIDSIRQYNSSANVTVINDYISDLNGSTHVINNLYLPGTSDVTVATLVALNGSETLTRWVTTSAWPITGAIIFNGRLYALQ